jgi:RNA polymerase sigma-70 factor (ECF subfamily)
MHQRFPRATTNFARWRPLRARHTLVKVSNESQPTAKFDGSHGRGSLHRKMTEQIPRLRRYARALTRSTREVDDLIDDLVQDCLARALSRIDLWQPGTDLRAWLFAILHNQYVNYVRRSVRERAVRDFCKISPRLACGANHRLELRDLRRAMSHLSHEQREVILMLALDGVKYRDAAKALEVPIGTIRSRVSRGREILRELTEGRIVPEAPRPQET